MFSSRPPRRPRVRIRGSEAQVADRADHNPKAVLVSRPLL